MNLEENEDDVEESSEEEDDGFYDIEDDYEQEIYADEERFLQWLYK